MPTFLDKIKYYDENGELVEVGAGGGGVISKTSTEWALENPVLPSGQIGYDTTLLFTKIGDGVTPWMSLPYFPTQPSPSFANDTWEQILQRKSSGLYQPGDVKIIINKGTYMVLDNVVDGKLPIAFVPAGGISQKMNQSNTTVGGWGQSDLRSYLNTADFIQSFTNNYGAPPITFMTVDTKKYNVDGTLSSVNDRIWLLSLAEVFSEKALTTSKDNGIRLQSEQIITEGTQYAYFKNTIGDSDPNNTTLVIGNRVISLAWFRTRKNASYFYKSGDVYSRYITYNSPNLAQFCIPCFCI